MILACLALSFGVSGLSAQDVSVNLSVNRNEISMGDNLQLTVQVSGKMRGVPDPVVRNLDNFSVVGRSQSSQFSIVNGQISSNKSFIYTMIPNNTGDFQLGPAEIEIDGKTYSSQSVSVKVSSAQSQPQAPASSGQQAPQGNNVAQAPAPQNINRTSSTPDGNAFVQSKVDKTEVFVGEQVIYTFSFYNRIRLSQNPSYDPATFQGFWSEALDDQAQRTNANVGGSVPMSSSNSVTRSFQLPAARQL